MHFSKNCPCKIMILEFEFINPQTGIIILKNEGKVLINVFTMKELAKDIEQFCRDYRVFCVEEERKEESQKIRQKLEMLCQQILGKLKIPEPNVLLALMDAYEITRNEKMLQQVLDVVSKNIDQLKVSAEGVKLLAYCYYYVEEEECAVKAREMLKELKRRGEQTEELAEVERIVEEMI